MSASSSSSAPKRYSVVAADMLAVLSVLPFGAALAMATSLQTIKDKLKMDGTTHVFFAMIGSQDVKRDDVSFGGQTRQAHEPHSVKYLCTAAVANTAEGIISRLQLWLLGAGV